MSTKSNAQFAVTAEIVQRMATELAETASHPEFLGMIEEVHNAPISQRKSVAEDVAHVEHVSSRGIPVPETFRITTRTFEDPEALSSIDEPHPGGPAVEFDGQSGSVIYQDMVITVREKRLLPIADSPDVVRAEIKNGIEAIGEFVASPAFQATLAELAELADEARSRFIVDELLEPTRRAQRGLSVPDGMRIQRSEFADGRPTLFCVSKLLPFAQPWHKVTITFDSA